MDSDLEEELCVLWDATVISVSIVDFHFRWNARGRCSGKFMVGAVSHIYIAAHGAYKP